VLKLTFSKELRLFWLLVPPFSTPVGGLADLIRCGLADLIRWILSWVPG